MRPSTIRTIRSQASAMRGSCVTTRNAVRSSRLYLRMRASTSVDDSVSRLPVGSSASTRAGSCKSARATQRNLLTMARSQPSPYATTVRVDIGLFVTKCWLPPKGSKSIIGHHPRARRGQECIGVSWSDTEVLSDSSQNVGERFVHANSRRWTFQRSNFIDTEPSIGSDIDRTVDSSTTDAHKSRREIIKMNKLNWRNCSTQLQPCCCPR